MDRHPIRLPYNWQETGGTIAQEDRVFPAYTEVFDRGTIPLDFLKIRRQWLREVFAIQMMEAIEQSKYPVVVEFEEKITPNYYGDNQDQYKLIARFTATQTRNIVFTRPEDIGFRPFHPANHPSLPAKIDFRKRLKFLFTGNREDLK